jgi:hypothetical protein
MTNGEDSAPRFLVSGSERTAAAPAALCQPDGAWDDQFSVPGPDSEVGAIAAIGTDLYVGPVLIEVPLKGPNQDWGSNASLKMQSITSAHPQGGRGTRDSDKLKLTCFPSDVTP